MTAQIKDLLREYAEEARVYDVGAVAVATARRRRVTQRLAVAAAAVLVVASAGLAYALPRPTANVAPTQTPTPSPTQGLALPDVITPQPAAPDLPGDRPVGRGLRTYRFGKNAALRATDFYLVTLGGQHYHLGPVPTSSSDYYVLSPDGRWLAWLTGDGPTSRTVLRDLTTTASYSFAGHARTWSADGRWLAVQRLRKLEGNWDPGYVAVVDTSQAGPLEPAFVNLHLPNAVIVSGVTPGGDLLFADFDHATLNLVMVNRSTGRVSRKLDVDFDKALTATEQATLSHDWYPEMTDLVGPVATASAPDGLLYLTVPGPVEMVPGRPHAVIVIDVATGHLVKRIALPDSVRSGAHEWEYWQLYRVLPQGFLLWHHSTEIRKYTMGYTLSWDLFNPDTGELTQLMDVSALSQPRQ